MFHQLGTKLMKLKVLTICSATAAIALISMAQAVTIDTVLVGNPGNAAKELPQYNYWGTHFGAVDYVYNIGTYEVTNTQYTEFLNAVAKTDPYGLYNAQPNSFNPGAMGNLIYGGITRTITPWGHYSYSVIPGKTNRPANSVGWAQAARFANWLHNGQPSGEQNSSTTEDGAYELNGATSMDALAAVSRESDWKWAIPSDNEWFKAAYHKNDGVTGNYFYYPTSSDTKPTAELPPGGTNSTNHLPASIMLDQLTDVGSYTLSASPYGTFDQSGNVWEWNESVHVGTHRGIRGGSFSTGTDSSFAFVGNCHYYAIDIDYGQCTWANNQELGFRVVSRVEMISNPLLGDANNDNQVTGADLVTAQQNFGNVDLDMPIDGLFLGDANDDGQVTGADLIAVQQKFGNTLGSASALIPEPASACLLTLASLGALARRSGFLA